jgi:DNA helicase MCM8
VQSFYLSLRASSCGGVSGGLPITARQLESLVRLAEARARAELREVVTAEDAMVSGCVNNVHALLPVRCMSCE